MESKCQIKEFKELEVGLIIHWTYNGELHSLDDLQLIMDTSKEYPYIVEVDDFIKVLVKDKEYMQNLIDEENSLVDYGVTKDDYLNDEEYTETYYKNKIAYILESKNIITIE